MKALVLAGSCVQVVLLELLKSRGIETVLADNNTYIDQYYLGEPTFCCLLETEGKKILFDAGYSDIFLNVHRFLMTFPAKRSTIHLLTCSTGGYPF